jgi:CubicO group peptidase (beta-lactamase class C family)
MIMTAGLSYDVKPEPILALKQESNNKASTREIVKAIAKMPLIAEPQTRWSYSIGHDVLAAVVEVVSGMKYSDYLQNNIFGSAGNHEFYFHSNDSIKNRISAIYEAEIFSDNILHCTEECALNYELTENYESGGACNRD